MTTLHSSDGADVTATFAWVLHRLAALSSRRAPASDYLETWFARAGERWPAVWFDIRRAPAAMLWVASRVAAADAFDVDEEALYDERAALRAAGNTLPRDIAEMLAIGDVLCSAGVMTAGEQLPAVIARFVERRGKRAA